MEFKEAIKIRRRICDYYKDYVACDGCPLKGFPVKGFPANCFDGIFEVENTDEYERILEEWAKKHPVVTNADKYIEVIKNTFGGTKLDKDKVHQRVCLQLVGKEIDSNKCASMCCSECLKWWDEEYKEPKKEKKNEKI